MFGFLTRRQLNNDLQDKGFESVKACYRLAVTSAVLLLFSASCNDAEKPRFSAEQLESIPPPVTANLPEVSGGLALSVGGQTLTADEVVAPFVENFKRTARNTDFETFQNHTIEQIDHLVVGRISGIILYELAAKQAGDVDEALEKAVEGEIRKFVDSFGGDYAKAEEALEQEGMDWADFRQHQRRTLLSQAYLASKMPDEHVTYKEMTNYYQSHKDDLFAKEPSITFRLIDLQPGGSALTGTSSGGEPAQLSAAEIMDRIRGGEDFAALARAHSRGPRRNSGGLWEAVNPANLAEPYDVLAEAAEMIEPPQLAGPLEVDGRVFIMKLEEKRTRRLEPFERVQRQIEARIVLQRRREAMDRISQELAEGARIINKDEFVNYCCKRIYLLCRQGLSD